MADEIGLGDILLLGKGEDAAGGRAEAVDPVATRSRPCSARSTSTAAPRRHTALVERLIGDRLETAAGQLDRLDHKTLLQELPRGRRHAPVYMVVARRARSCQDVRRPVLVDGACCSASGEGTFEEVRRAAGCVRRRTTACRCAGSSRPMPELPEVETVRRGLARYVVGRRIERVEVGRERTVRRTSRAGVIDGLTGATIHRPDRRGKYLLCSLDTGDTLMIHLRMSGQVLLAAAGRPRPAHTHVVLHLDGSAARGAVVRRSAHVRRGGGVRSRPRRRRAARAGAARDRPDRRRHLGCAARRHRCAARARQLKPLLLDQHVIAGIGNIYADEILHRARLRPDRVANTLETRRDQASARRDPLDPRRRRSRPVAARLSDTQYVDLMGDGGSFQVDHRVYDRAGQRCLTCGKATIVRTVSGGRSTCFCPRCQH